MMVAMLLPLVKYLDEGHVKFILVGQIHRNDQLLVSDCCCWWSRAVAVFHWDRR